MTNENQFIKLSQVIKKVLDIKKSIRTYLIANKVLEISLKVILDEFPNFKNLVKLDKFKEGKIYISSNSSEVLFSIKMKQDYLLKRIKAQLPWLKELKICYRLK